MIETIEPIALTELSVASEFTCATPQMARRLDDIGALRPIEGYRRPKLTGWRGDPHIGRLDLDHRKKGIGKPRVLYGPSIMLGPRQLFPPLLPDPIHLDWQFRLVEMLQTLPIDLICRPHPEGFVYGRAHPLGAITPLASERFEDLIPDSEVLVFDYAQSTTFPVALCSPHPVVFIDFGNPLFTSSIQEALARRCHIVRAWFDDRNRPQIDQEELAEAILGDRALPDPSEFRAMLLTPE